MTMTTALDYLETLAVSPYGACDGVPAGLPAPVRDALLAGDAAALADLLGGRAAMACSIMAPDRDEPDSNEEPVSPEDAPDERESDAA
jgi:hypothetical protein